MINFDALPSDKPVSLIPKGTYYATIEKAEMKQPKEVSKKPYLDLTLAIKDKDGKSIGKIFEKISESDHELMRYKLKRFIEALNIPIKGTFELKDLCKIVVGKSFIVDITKEEKEGYSPKSIVDLFTNEIFYPMSEASNIFGVPEENSEDPIFVDANDAEDANVVSEDSEDEEY